MKTRVTMHEKKICLEKTFVARRALGTYECRTDVGVDVVKTKRKEEDWGEVGGGLHRPWTRPRVIVEER